MLAGRFLRRLAMRAYSMDLRVRALADWDADLGTMAVARKDRVSDSWVRNLKRRRRETGQVGPRPQRVSHATKLDAHQQQLEQLVAQQPDATLEELRQRLDVRVAPATLWRALRRMQFTFKKK
jgi:transposase